VPGSVQQIRKRRSMLPEAEHKRGTGKARWSKGEDS
jgi:hypothetical protein